MSRKEFVKNKFIDLNLLPVVFQIAWPTMLGEVFHTLVQYIDTAMVGAIGTYATAAVGSTTTVSWLVGSTISALSVGFLAYISQACGAGEKLRAQKAVGQAALITIIAGVLSTVVTLAVSPYVPAWMHVDPQLRSIASSYFAILYMPMLFKTVTIIMGTVLRAFGDTKTPMKSGLVTNILNVILNFVLIYETRTVSIFGFSFSVYGMGKGVIGAAIASAISYTVGGIIIAIVVLRNKEIVPGKLSLKPDASILRPCLKIAIPNMLQRFCTSLGYVVFASMINALGEISTAAHTIANTVESAFYIPGYGMMSAASVLTGNAIGAKDEEKRKSLSRIIWLVEFLMMCVSGGLLFIFTVPIVRIFTKDAAVIMLSGTVLKMVSVSEPFYGISIVTEGMLMGAGQTKRPFAFNVACMWGIRIVGTFICTTFLKLGLQSAWGCMIAGNVSLMVLFVLYYTRGNWKTIIDFDE